MKHRLAFAAIALFGMALDLWTKSLAFRHVPPGGEIVVIEGFFSYGRMTNPGIVFGLFQDAKKLFLIISILAVPAVTAIFWSMRNPRWIVTVSLALILGGTLGNMVDRVVPPNEVRDFIKFQYDGRVWPLFNLADSCICVGVALLSIEMLFFDEKKKRKPAEEGRGLSTAEIAVGPTEPMPRADAPEIPDARPHDGTAPAPPGPSA